ncbi:MAG: hypothetical protein FVQ81_17075 [Candidatus Glassbacteria bacterium]|nr:hypothetical protein [Candidatus Glassbacteria bacterium]
MNVSPIGTLMLLLIVFVFSALPAAAHFRPMIEVTRPVASPPLEPQDDWAVLEVTVVDGFPGKKTSAHVSINGGTVEPENNPYVRFGLRYSGNRLKGPVRFRDLDYYFYTDGEFTVKVPPGRCMLEAGRGYEYLSAKTEVTVEPRDTLALTLRLRRWTDMAARGWYAGDTHIHMDRTGSNDDSLLTLTSARGIRYAYMLSMNTAGYAQGGQYEGWLQQKGLGDMSACRRDGYFLSSGQEYRSGELGHVTIILPDSYVPGPDSSSADVGAGPSLGIIADQAHKLRGYLGLAHGGYHNTETDGLLLDDKMDFLELLQFGGYRSLGLDGWYDFLNIGFRLPIVGACDFPYTRELASEITYVCADTEPNPRSWAELAAEGRSFATSGPMIFLEADNLRPGDIISLGENTDTTLTVNIQVNSPLYPVTSVELIVNGWARVRESFREPQSSVSLTRELRIIGSSWIAARASGPAGTEAHTNPVYIYVGGRLPFNRDSARSIISRLEGSMESVSSAEVRGRLARARQALDAMLEGRPSSLPLPSPE